MQAASLIPAFFDASSLMAASGSPTGGSSVLLIHAKLPAPAWERWAYLLLTTPLTVVAVPPNAGRFADAVTAKDAHVYAATLAAHLPYLVTLDQPFARRVNALGGPVRALFLGEFIRELIRARRGGEEPGRV